MLICYCSLLCVGVLQADPGVIREHKHIFRLYCHEAQRVFHDRLINQEDKSYFCGILSEMSSKHFSQVRDACLSPSLYPSPKWPWVGMYISILYDCGLGVSMDYRVHYSDFLQHVLCRK